MITIVDFFEKERVLIVRVGKTDIGEIFAVEDTGEYLFEPGERRSAFPAWFMHKIADKLDELNAQLAIENHP